MIPLQMPPRRAQRKVPGGKLVRIEADCDGGHFSKVLITGDFFVHPEEALGQIEKDIEESALNGNEEELERLIESIIQSNDARLVGFGAKDIAEILKEIRC